MASTIITKNNTTGTPGVSDLVQGELAINVSNGSLYYGAAGGTAVSQSFTFSDITASGNISASGNVEGGSLRADDLTAGRVAFIGTDGLLVDDSDLTFTTATLTATNLASTTVDTTNLEVTTIKAKDGTAAMGIANSNGKVTINDSILTTTDINGGTIDGCNITVGGLKTLDIRNGTVNFADDAISGDKVEGGTINATTITTLTTAAINASTDIDIGDNNFRAETLQADTLNTGQVIFAGNQGVLSTDSDLTFATDTLTATKIGAFEAAGAINFNSQNMTNVDIDSGTIDNTDVTVGSGKTLNVSAGTLTTSAAQKQAIVAGADGAAIDNCIIGANTAAAATFTSLTSTTSVGIPFIIGKESGYLASFTDDNYYYGNNAYGWNHHSFTNKLPNSPVGSFLTQTDGGTAIGNARQHTAQIVPVACKNITLMGEADVSTDGNTFAFFIYKTTRQNGSSTSPTITEIGTTSVTLSTATRYYNIDITTTEGVAAGDKILIVVRPGGTSGQVRWTYTLFGYTNG